MKLRNKKTGEIVDDVQYRNYSFSDGFGLRTAEKDYEYRTLAKFVDEWEDYTPPEPLIKNEKIRKAVKAWAEVCGEDCIIFSRNCEYNDHCFYTNKGGDLTFSVGVDLKEGSYTVAELCGEEE